MRLMPPSIPDRLSRQRLSVTNLNTPSPDADAGGDDIGSAFDGECLRLINEYYYGVRIFPGQDPAHALGIDRDIAQIDELDAVLGGQGPEEVVTGDEALLEKDVAQHATGLTTGLQGLLDRGLFDEAQVDQDLAQSSAGCLWRARAHGEQLRNGSPLVEGEGSSRP